MDEEPCQDSDKEQPILYTGRAFVRSRRRGSTWVSLNNNRNRGAVLIVRRESVEVVASQGMLLESRDILISAPNATMSLDKIGWAGSPIDKKECIRIVGHTGRRRMELAVTPDTGLQEAWQALLDAGVDGQ